MTCSSTALDHGGYPDNSLQEDFVTFVEENTRLLMRSAYLLTGSSAAAEDLAQDTLLRLYPRWNKVRDADLPLAYVRRAMTNQFLNTRRRGIDREISTGSVPDRPSERRVDSDVVDRDQVWGLLRKLNMRERTALVLRYYEGLNDVEIAKQLQCRPGTARSLISRGLANLRRAASVQG